jgi:hypothetical protein
MEIGPFSFGFGSFISFAITTCSHGISRHAVDIGKENLIHSLSTSE